MPIQQIDPKTAHEQMGKDPGAVLIDVRTVEEFVAGHPKGAKNIPVRMRDATSGQMLPNADFGAIAGKLASKDQAIYCTCRSGQRSLMAAMILEQMGYAKLFNIKGGFEGSETTRGWADEGLPVSNDNGAGVSYESLRAQGQK